MKGCARTCLLWLIGCVAAGGAFYVYLRQSGEQRPQIWWASGGAGVCVVLTISYAVAIRTSAKERSMLLGAMVGRTPDDGAWVAVSGTIRSLNPLRTPLTGATAVAYQYEIYRMESSGGRNSSSTKTTYYEGKALAPSTITTRQGAVRLLAVPTLDVPAESPKTAAAIANAREYVSTTAFQSSKTLKEHRTGVEQESTDDDGEFRVDKRGSDREIEIEECILEERHIKQGEMVCAFGLYSSMRGGLIPHPNWANQARLMRGDATTVANQLRNRIIKYCIGIVFFGAAAYGIVRLYQWYAIGQMGPM